jgi:hypothetical protein
MALLLAGEVDLIALAGFECDLVDLVPGPAG